MTLDEFNERLDQLPDSQLINETHLAAWLQVSKSKLQKDRLSGTGIRFHKIAGSVRYRVGEVKAHLENSLHSSTTVYFVTEIDLPWLPEPGCEPFAIVNGAPMKFFDSLELDAEEVVWLASNDQSLMTTITGGRKP